MQLDVVIDVVCPWCYVGKKQLDKALEMRPGIVNDIWWRPYQLGPETPFDGIDRATYYRKKFGEGPQLETMREHLHALAKQLGISFDFESDCLIANTLDAHRVIRWAKAKDVQEPVVDALMQQYFESCAFLGDHALLVDIASKAGMDKSLVADLLASDQDKDLITGEVSRARQMGIQGVPMFVFNGVTAVSGAQDADTLVEVIDQLSHEKGDSVNHPPVQS